MFYSHFSPTDPPVTGSTTDRSHKGVLDPRIPAREQQQQFPWEDRRAGSKYLPLIPDTPSHPAEEKSARFTSRLFPFNRCLVCSSFPFIFKRSFIFSSVLLCCSKPQKLRLNTAFGADFGLKNTQNKDLDNTYAGSFCWHPVKHSFVRLKEGKKASQK